jgi:hypothetical protein
MSSGTFCHKHDVQHTDRTARCQCGNAHILRVAGVRRSHRRPDSSPRTTGRRSARTPGPFEVPQRRRALRLRPGRVSLVRCTSHHLERVAIAARQLPSRSTIGRRPHAARFVRWRTDDSVAGRYSRVVPAGQGVLVFGAILIGIHPIARSERSDLRVRRRRRLLPAESRRCRVRDRAVLHRAPAVPPG